jgi:hypothetical protein
MNRSRTPWVQQRGRYPEVEWPPCVNAPTSQVAFIAVRCSSNLATAF